MKRREFLQLGALVTAATAVGQAVIAPRAFAAGGKPLADKDLLKDGQPASIANYCADTGKSTKTCKDRKEGNCENCNFFNKDNSLTDYKGGKYARCMLLTDASKPQFVKSTGWCATYVKKA